MLEKSREEIRKIPLDKTEEEIEFFAPALVVNLLLIEFIKRGLELSTYEPAKIEEREKAGLNPERLYLKFRGDFKEEQIKTLVDALEGWYRSAYDFLPLETTDEDVIAAVEWSPTLYDEMTLRGIERHFANVYDVCPEYIEEYKHSITEKKDKEEKCDLKDPLSGLERVQSQIFAIKKFRRVNNHDPEAKLIDPTLIRCKVNEEQLLALDRATSKLEKDIRKELHSLWFRNWESEPGDFLIKSAGLPTIEDAKDLISEEDRKYKGFWWLQPIVQKDNFVPDVEADGTISYCGDYVNTTDTYIRPVLNIYLDSFSTFKIGDIFKFGGKQFKIISEEKAFCLNDIGMRSFNDAMDDGNDYETSAMKKYIDKWFQENNQKK